MCKTGQPHRWQATVSNRSNGSGCPHETGRAVCPVGHLQGAHKTVYLVQAPKQTPSGAHLLAVTDNNVKVNHEQHTKMVASNDCFVSGRLSSSCRLLLADGPWS